MRGLVAALLDAVIDAYERAYARRRMRAELLAWRVRTERAEAALQARDIVQAEHYSQQSYGRWGTN